MTFRIRPFHVGILASIVAALLVVLMPDDWLEGGRELYFDRLTQIVSVPASPAIVVIDIDRKSYAAVPDQKWQRANTAELVEKIAADNPSVIAFDLVFSTDCNPEDATNGKLAAAMGKAPALLGFLLSDVEGQSPRPLPPLAIAKSLTVPDFWFLPGAEASCPVFQQKAASTGASFLIGDEDSRVRKPRGFHLRNSAAHREWNTPSAKATFSAVALSEATEHHVARGDDGLFVMQTFRSHDQYNTTIYGMDDRYRGVYGERRVVFVNPEDMKLIDAQSGDRVDVVGRHDDGISRIADDFRLVPYDIPRGCVAGYYPELNVLVPLSTFGSESDTPASKSVLVSFRKRVAALAA